MPPAWGGHAITRACRPHCCRRVDVMADDADGIAAPTLPTGQARPFSHT